MAITGAAIATWVAANAGTIAAASAAASVATTAYTGYAQKQQADAEYDYQNESNREQAKQVAASYDDLSATEIDLNKQAANDALQQDLATKQVQGRINVFAAAAGTYGGSVDSLLFDAEQTKEKNINTILDRKAAGLYSIKQQAEQSRQSGIAAQSNKSISSPSWMEIGVNTATSAVKAGGSYLDQYNSTFSKQATQTNTIKGGV